MCQSFGGQVVSASLPTSQHIPYVKLKGVLEDFSDTGCQEVAGVLNFSIGERNRIPEIAETDMCTDSRYPIFCPNSELQCCCIELLEIILRNVVRWCWIRNGSASNP